MPVVLAPGWPGILLHEAIGHGLEGDFNRKGLSAFSGRIGERVAAPGVTVVDDGTIADRRGSLKLELGDKAGANEARLSRHRPRNSCEPQPAGDLSQAPGREPSLHPL